MDTRQLARIDLNLLVALQVLIEECNVSKAAERLYVTQSAMSKTLGRLRDLFDDPLFTRGSHGMIATPRALELQKQLNLLLQGVQTLVAPQEFDPGTFHGEMRIAIPEIIGMGILPPLMEELQREAPHLRIVAITRVEHQLDKLGSGELDIAVHIKHTNYSADFIVDQIASWPPVLMVRQGHPLRALPKKLEPKHFEKMMSYPLVRWYMPDMDESEMRRSPEFRRIAEAVDVALETSHLFSAIEVVKRTNCILMGAPFITRHPQLGVGLATVSLPHDEKSMIHYVMATHKRVESSAPHQWVREKILEIISHLDDEEESGDPYQDYKLGRPKVFNRGSKKAS
jgi:DNA-binding transcriptional LysR family regulator